MRAALSGRERPRLAAAGWTQDLLLLAAIFAVLMLVHAPLLRLPYFWDEAGYYIPAARDLYLTGTLIPHSTPSNAHPPLIMAWLALEVSPLLLGCQLAAPLLDLKSTWPRFTAAAFAIVRPPFQRWPNCGLHRWQRFATWPNFPTASLSVAVRWKFCDVCAIRSCPVWPSKEWPTPV